MNKNIIISIFLVLGSAFCLLGMEGQQPRKRPLKSDSQQEDSQKKPRLNMEYSFCPIHLIKTQTRQGLTNHIEVQHYNKEKNRFDCQLCPADFPIPHDVFLHWAGKEHKLFYTQSNTNQLTPNKNTPTPMPAPMSKKIIIAHDICSCMRSRITTSIGLCIHLKSHHYDKEKNLIHCPYNCGATFNKSENENAISHLEVVHNFFLEERIIYDPRKTPNIPEQSSQSLPQEMVVVHKFALHECPMYNKNPITIKDLTEHIEFDHRNDERFVCKYDDCARSFSMAGDVIKHLINDHKLFVKTVNKLIPVTSPPKTIKPILEKLQKTVIQRHDGKVQTIYAPVPRSLEDIPEDLTSD